MGCQKVFVRCTKYVPVYFARARMWLVFVSSHFIAFCLQSLPVSSSPLTHSYDFASNGEGFQLRLGTACLPAFLFLCLSVCPSICPSVCLSVCLSCLSVLSVCFVCLSVCLSVCLPVCLSCLSGCLSVSLFVFRSCLSVFPYLSVSLYLRISGGATPRECDAEDLVGVRGSGGERLVSSRSCFRRASVRFRFVFGVVRSVFD